MCVGRVRDPPEHPAETRETMNRSIISGVSLTLSSSVLGPSLSAGGMLMRDEGGVTFIPRRWGPTDFGIVGIFCYGVEHMCPWRRNR